MSDAENLPMWRDANLGSFTPIVRASHFIAATRVATGESELAITNVQPFTKGNISFTHNGVLESFEDSFLNPLRLKISAKGQSLLRGVTDSAHLFALLLDALSASGGLGLAVDSVIGTVSKLCIGLNKGATLNLLLSDGREAVAVRYASRGKAPPSLYWRSLGGAILVASERLDGDPQWQSVLANTRMSFIGGAFSSQTSLAVE